MLQRLRNRQRGFTLIELLIVVAIIGIIAAILIPNLIDALQKAKQKRTMADMRNVGTAFMSYVTDAASAAAAGSQTNNFDATPYTAMNVTGTSGLFSILHPSQTFFYMNEVPKVDGWKNSYGYGRNPNVLASQVFAIMSEGRNGDGTVDIANDANGRVIGPFVPTDYDQDIIWADGFFVRWPGGLTN